MKHLRRIIFSLIIIVCINLLPLLSIYRELFGQPVPRLLSAVITLLFIMIYILINIRPQPAVLPSKPLRALSDGCELLRLFLVSATVSLAIQIYSLCTVLPQVFPWQPSVSGGMLLRLVLGLVFALLGVSIVFWGGMIRLYTTSVQLGIKHRVLGVVFAWIPVLNIYYLLKLIRTAEREVELESSKYALNALRASDGVCKTRYPLLLVHGVFFRDFRYLNYWGRIPAELLKNGATVYYGEQESAASVEDCGKQLAARIKKIVEETGCEKVNIISHSKGGLDSRSAISSHGAAPYVASLTTINTPHRGCIFAEHLMNAVPERVRLSIAGTYNAALKKLGDRSPDFLAAVTDLTASACAEFNEKTPDADGVLYESVMSYCRRARSGKFPLNLSYPLVKHYDGKNDGLVAEDSAVWGGRFTLVEPKGSRGISHGDMIDLNRENIPGFDVREFYVSLASSLKDRGC